MTGHNPQQVWLGFLFDYNAMSSHHYIGITVGRIMKTLLRNLDNLPNDII